jgi:hypothetical protein
MTVEFEPWPKIARLNRDIVVTEKIDGTNAAVLILHSDDVDWVVTEGGPDGKGGVEIITRRLFEDDARNLVGSVAAPDGAVYYVFAQSRSRFITPGKGTDNYGFAGWVEENIEALVETLGPGRHFGEWWGQGIQRGYGLKEKRFSLFNTSRWKDTQFEVPGLATVPVLYWGPQSEERIKTTLATLNAHGSAAAARLGSFHQPAEGIVIWHTAGRTFSKVTLKGDEAPKGPEGHANDEENPA